MSNYYQDLGSDWSDPLIKYGGKVLKGAVSVVQTQSELKGQAAAYKEMALREAAKQKAEGTPKWLLPVGIGAGALALIILLKD